MNKASGCNEIPVELFQILKDDAVKTEIMASGPITSWQIDGVTPETVTDFFEGRGAPKSLQMVTAAMK